MNDVQLAAELQAVLGSPVRRLSALSGGCVARVHRATLDDGRELVVKSSGSDAELALEGQMLEALAAEDWPVPDVLHATGGLLVMDHVAHDGEQGDRGDEAAADLLAALHTVPRPAFGFPRDTLIAGLSQVNGEHARWLPFFTENRLLAMADIALQRGRLDIDTRRRIDHLAGMLDRWLTEPAHPSLIHGDLWGGNILFDRGRVAAVIDPACYWADAEIELAFTTLFHSFGERFYARYAERRPLAPGFFEERRDLYNLYPLLVHVTLFGASYLGAVQATLRRFGA